MDTPGDLPLRIRGPGTSWGPNPQDKGDPDQQGSLWWPWDPTGTRTPHWQYLLDGQLLLISGGQVLVVCTHHHSVSGPGHRQALSTGHWHGDRVFLGHPVPVPRPRPDGSRAGAYLTPQWAAVTTQFSLISDPPQKWKPLWRWQGERPSAPGTAGTAAGVLCAWPQHPPWHPAQHPPWPHRGHSPGGRPAMARTPAPPAPH